MTDQATVDLEGVEEQTAPGAEPDREQGEPAAELGDPGRRALQAERTARAEAERQLREAQQQLTTQASRITELETGTGSLTTQIEDLQREGLRYRVAVEKGLAPELVGRLVGSTAEELAADADSLLSLMGARPTTPRPDPSQGSRSPAPQSAAELGRAALGALLNH